MFEVNQKASPRHRYDSAWLKAPEALFGNHVNTWLATLAAHPLRGGPNAATRQALVEEFYLLAHAHDVFTRQRCRTLNLPMADGPAQKIRKFEQLHRTHFRAEPVTDPRAAHAMMMRVANLADAMATKLHPFLVKQRILERKVQVLNHWIAGVHRFHEYDSSLPLMVQYLHASSRAKVAAVLNVLLRDAARLVDAPNPVAGGFKVTSERGANASSEVVWTKEEFLTAVKAEAGASYGVSRSATGEWQISGLKAKMSAEAFAGARAKAAAQGKIDYERREISGSAEVEVMVGIDLKFDASIECGDFFMAEIGAQGFAGALANASASFTISGEGFRFAASAEAFAGARLTGHGSFAIKIQGYEILSGKVEGALTAGIGAAFKFECEASAMGSVSFEFKAGATMGLGADASMALTITPGNLSKAAESIYYRIYLLSILEGSEYHAYFEHFRELEDNEEALMTARAQIWRYMETVEQQIERAAAIDAELREFAKLAECEAPLRPPVISALAYAAAPWTPVRKAPAARRGGALAVSR